MKNTIYLLFIIYSFFLSACHFNSQKKELASPLNPEKQEIKYAQGFTISNYGDFQLVDIQDPSGESELEYHYALLQKGKSKDKIPSHYEIIETPIKRVICMTNLQLSHFIKLGAVDKVVGISSTRFLFNPQIKEQIQTGYTQKIGIEGDFDTELVMALHPDIILVSPFKRGGYESIRNLGIPLISFLGYKETSPLGQAEWLKLIGLFLGIEEQAKKEFLEIEKKYLALKALSQTVTKKPVVLSGELHSGNWYVVGGKSYLAYLFTDAGANYFMKKDEESGGFYVDFETAYAQGAHADFWRIVNSYNGTFSYPVLEQTDARYTDFKAFQDKKVIYCNLRQKPFYENTPVEPEVVLADLIKIFHPDLLPDHIPVYYDLLK